MKVLVSNEIVSQADDLEEKTKSAIFDLYSFCADKTIDELSQLDNVIKVQKSDAEFYLIKKNNITIVAKYLVESNTLVFADLLNSGTLTHFYDEDLYKEDLNSETKSWFFNSNETYSPNAYIKMFDKSVIAIYGYGSGQKISRTNIGDNIFLYINGQGIRGLGKVINNKPINNIGVFSDDFNSISDEYHLNVDWIIKLDANNAISNRTIRSDGFNLPIRSTFAKIHDINLEKYLMKKLEELKFND